MRIITVKGTGNVSARPDYIILSLNIEVLSETYDRAMSEAAERIERLQGAAVRVGYRKEDLKTTSFDVQTRYENVKDRQGNYKREFAGYACSYRLKLAFVPDEHGLYDVVQILLGGLTVLLVKREEDEREHDNHHQHCRRRQVEMCLRQKENRDTDCRSDGKTNELPLGQVEHDLRFDAVKILRDRNKCHCLFPPFRE